jgi:hypothetical protein
MPILMPALMKMMNPERMVGPDHRYTIDWATPIAEQSPPPRATDVSRRRR